MTAIVKTTAREKPDLARPQSNDHSPTAHKLKYAWLRCRQLVFGGRRPEVRPKDGFGAALQAVIRAYQPSAILELGSWDGRGSTACLLRKLNYRPEFLHCVEVFPERADLIRRQITPLFPFVQVHNLSTISYDDWSYKDFERDLWGPIPQDQKERLDRQKLRSAWEQEERVLREARTTYFQRFPAQRYDMVLIDGGECTGPDEFRLLDERYDIIALDDVFWAFKSYEPYRKLLQNPRFELVACSMFVRRGFAVFVRKTRRRIQLAGGA